jgi:carbonic anhydrase/acetyltransferase-like protein (isoleucine patch superfamily)
MARVYAYDRVVPVIDPTAFVHPEAVVIGDVLVGPNCYVGPGAVLRGDFAGSRWGRSEPAGDLRRPQLSEP